MTLPASRSWDFGSGFSHLPRPWRWISIALFTLAALALLFQFGVYGHYTVSLLRFPYDYDQGEGFELYDTVLHTQGEWPYRDSQVFPFYTSIYPPLFHLLTAPLVLAFGPQLWTGRAVSFAASLVAAGAIGYGVPRAARQPVFALFSGLAFLASNYTFAIGPLFRQHMTMVMFETLAIVALAQWSNTTLNHEVHQETQRTPKGFVPFVLSLCSSWLKNPFWPGLVFLLCAGYSKQLAAATVAGALAFLFLRGPQRALLTALSLGGAAGAIFLWINWQTGGWWYVSIIRANINAYDLAQTLSFYREWFELHAVLGLAAFGWLIYETYFGRLSIYAIWFVFALANGALSGKFGAGESYFVTATAAACVLLGISAGRLWTLAGQFALRFNVLVALALPLLFLIQTRLTLHTYTDGPVYGAIARALGVTDNSGREFYDSQGYTQLGPRPKRADAEAGDQLAELARRAPGPVFSEEAALMFRAGKPVVTNPFPQLVMYQAGLFDPAREIEMINAKAFGLVILRAQFYPPPVLAALGANYRPRTEIAMNGFVYRVLEPRP